MNQSLIVTQVFNTSLLGNMNPRTADSIFLGEVWETLGTFIPLLMNSSGSDNGSFVLPSLDDIESTFDNAFATFLKTYSIGYLNSTLNSTITAPASLVVSDQLHLVTSNHILIVASILVGVVLIFVLGSIACSGTERQAFNLENIIRVVQNPDVPLEFEKLCAQEANGASEWDPRSLYEESDQLLASDSNGV
jgi:hypothetical protein